MFVTSFSPDGYALYGEKFLLSFLAHSDESITVYYEDVPPPLTDERIIYKNLFDVPGCLQFLEVCLRVPAFKGEVNGKVNYRYNIFRFSRKSFAQIDAAQYDDKLFWIDADVVLKDTLEIPEFDGKFMMYLGRPKWHSCASFVGWDNTHKQANEFWSVYMQLYLSGQIFILPEWHDSFILDEIRNGLQLESKNLADGINIDGPFNVFDHVFSWGNHKKGNLKYAAA